MKSLGRLFIFSLLVHLNAVWAASALQLSATLPGDWAPVGRANIQTGADSAVIQGGFVVSKEAWDDVEISFDTRAPAGTEQVQSWGGFRCRDRDSRYVFALRGGDDNDVYLARYAPDGGNKFLGFSPLDFKPAVGTWYRLRVVALGNRVQIYLNDEKLPRINVADADAPWAGGSVALGGGWLPAEYANLEVKPLSGADRAAFLAIGDRVWTPPARNKEAARLEERAEYRPVDVPAFGPQRTEVSLDGNWLFMPDYQVSSETSPASPDYDDHGWHVMQVPAFWTPGLSWLHGETGFPDLRGPAVTKGVADSLTVQEAQRVQSYTFDWKKTKAAWYRHYVNLPDDLRGRRFELSFDAIAKVSEIWVNGVKVGAHTGMFGDIKCDVTSAMRPGRNVVAVHVTGQAGDQSPNTVEGVAVTVEVTSRMLHSLPHGMLQDDAAGIWQPVKLTVSAPILVNDCFVEPRLNGADLNLEILNSGQEPSRVGVEYTITSAQDGSKLFETPSPTPVDLVAGENKSIRLSTPVLAPRWWSPQDPNLYNLEVRLRRGDEVIDRYSTRFGFRTFTVDGDRFLLNGRPYWLRGADPFPNTLRPNDPVFARRFAEIAREGNVMVTRSHIVPFTSTWLDAADEAGVGVSFEGGWPWLMLEGDPPDERLLKIWKEEYLSLIREHRNHPSLLLWTVNNEMKFEMFDADNPGRLKIKWAILDDTIKAMRRTDPTRPIVADSGYVRKESAKGYRTVVQPDGFDDGDVDDAHRYYGWYNESFFHLYDGQYEQQLHTPGRPLISQEMSTGYPQNDDGHPVRFYLFKHYTPQALVGDDAYEQADPAIFLQRQSFMTKELVETIRRTGRDSTAGLLDFSYLTWFKKPWSAGELEPWPTYYALRTAMQPVLVSAELYGRHFYAGQTVRRRVCIINDSENGAEIPAGNLVWRVVAGGDVLASGSVAVPATGYYQNQWLGMDFALPAILPSPRVDAQLTLSLEARGSEVSENHYDIVIASNDWAQNPVVGRAASVLNDPSGKLSAMLPDLRVSPLRSIDSATDGNVLIVVDAASLLSKPGEREKLREFISRGGRALLIHPGPALAKMFPDQIRSFAPKDGEIATMHVPESPVFSEIEPLDLAWFERGEGHLPIACSGIYHVTPSREDTTALASQCDIHGYLKDTPDILKYSGSPLVEIQLGKGRLLASEMNFESSNADPIARRLLANAVRYLQVDDSRAGSE